MTGVVRVRDVDPVAEPANHVHVRPLVTAAAGPDVSMTWVQIAGRHRRLRTTRSTRVYTVVDGSVTVQLDDEPAVLAGAGDTVVVPRGRPYELTGVGTYLVINAPAFVDGDDEYVDGDTDTDGPGSAR